MTAVRRVGEWVHAQVGTDRVMMNLASGNYVGVTAIGARIWDLLDECASVDDVCTALLRQYDVEPATCRTDVQAFLEELAAAGAVALDPAT